MIGATELLPAPAALPSSTRPALSFTNTATNGFTRASVLCDTAAADIAPRLTLAPLSRRSIPDSGEPHRQLTAAVAVPPEASTQTATAPTRSQPSCCTTLVHPGYPPDLLQHRDATKSFSGLKTSVPVGIGTPFKLGCGTPGDSVH